MERIGGEGEGQRTSLWQVIGASVIGTVMEWYDFFIYAAAAALVFPALFFPESEPLTGTLLAFGTYALGFFVRPVGGIIFGNLGDKIGRKTILVVTLLLMGIATTLIGVLPTFERIGLWAAVLLLVLRILQGLGAGAEFGGAVIMAAEYSPQGKRGLYASLPCTGVAIGLLLSSGVFALFSALPEEQFLSWGWRIPFLLSIVVVAVGLYVRLRVLETPVFSQVKETNTVVETPVLEVVRSQPRNLLVAIGARFSENGNAYIIQTFTLTYVATQLGMSDSVALTGVLISAAIGIFSIPLFGALSDRVGRRPVYMFGSAFLALFSFPFFWLLNTEVNVLIWLAIVLANSLGVYSMFAPQAAYFSELFDTRVRYSGLALAREVSAPFAGGIAPFVATYLLSRTGTYWPIALYMLVLALITLVALAFGPETYRRKISEEEVMKESVGLQQASPAQGRR
jgi:MFS transporter, MHS family, shikimate and dehydroshikimate transport protein